MGEYLAKNGGTICVAIVLIIIVTLIIKKLIKDKRAGKTCSGCGDACNCCKPVYKNGKNA
ncbi:MAG: FeoB-associated Cys-rich membrane protein [Fusobacteriaceae bacterium]|jgi:hypothetical protein|nr:FeoB-associated Cys-rich membrane protein [Fusobacteriaceae bacterium]